MLCRVVLCQVIEEQHTFLDRQVALLRCSLEPLTPDDKVGGCWGRGGSGGRHCLWTVGSIYWGGIEGEACLLLLLDTTA